MVRLDIPDDFRIYAGKKQERWDLLVGGTIEYPELGIGVVKSVQIRTGLFGGVKLKIHFDETEKTFPADVLKRTARMTFPIATLKRMRDEGIDISKLPAPESPEEPARIKTKRRPRPRTTEYKPPKQEKQSVEMTEKAEPATIPNPPIQPIPAQKTTTQKFFENEEICLRSNPAKRGVIRKVMELGDHQWNYEVYFSQQESRIFEEKELERPRVEKIIGYDREFLRDLLILKLQKPIEDNLYSAYASKTKFEVYQFKPAIKFLRNTSQRLLIADEVGLGKTIEAGIIYLELQARTHMPRVLIVCPSGLRYKWRDEFKSRFDEDFDVLDRKELNQFIDKYNRLGENTRLRGIASLEMLRVDQAGNLIRNTNVHFDLVIIDEAHHCRNSETLSFHLATLLEDRSDAMILMTATPLQTSNQDLFNLFKILEPGEFDEFNAFESRLTPNTHVNEAAQLLQIHEAERALEELRRVERTNQRERFKANPYYRELINVLQKPNLSSKELIYAQRIIQDLNTLSLFFTRTRKRDVVINPPIRTAETVIVPFSEAEMEYYEKVIEFIKGIYILAHPGASVYTWITMMKERQVASCLAGFHRQFIQKIPDFEPYTPEEENLDFSSATEENEDFLDSNSYRRSLENIADFLKNWKPPRDTKFDLFLKAVQQIFANEPETKVIVFSFFKGTVDYLYEMMNQNQIKAIKMHGGNIVDERQSIMQSFKERPEIRVLISSDVGAEGLDFQFCDTIFNYDMPWNPMKVEQRIGRIDRFGQLSPRVRIYNLVIQDTIEERILLRLYERIGLFKHAIGDIEEILGEEINELAKMVLSKKLTPAEEKLQLDLTARNIERREQELEEFEQKRLQFIGQDAIFRNQIEETLDSGGYISANELSALVGAFIKNCDELSRFEYNGENDGTYCLTVNDHLNSYIRNYVLEERKGNLSYQTFLQRMRPGKEIPLTFNNQVAFDRKPEVEFITARHPLAQSAVHYWRSQPAKGEMIYQVEINSGKETAGIYPFFIFLLESKGFKSAMQLLPVVVDSRSRQVDKRLGRKFLKLVQNDLLFNRKGGMQTDPEVMDQARRAAMEHMATVRKNQALEYQKENEMLINARRTALTQSYEAKKRRIEGAMEKTRDERIIRMRKGELRNITSRYQFELEKMNVRDVVVSFMLEIEGYLIIKNKE